MKSAFLLSLLSIFLITCSNKWVAIPQGVPDYKLCKGGGPHLISVPGFEGTFAMLERCSSVDRERVSIAIKVFILQWERVFYEKKEAAIVRKALEGLVINFDNKDKKARAYDMSGEFGESFSLSGLCLSPSWVWVKIADGERLCDTSLAHELVHIIIWNKRGDHGDPDHLGGKYYGWNPRHNIVIQNTNALLCELGI